MIGDFLRARISSTRPSGFDENGARFGKTAARIPARRIPEALDRVLALYRAEKKEGETATAFFLRAEVAHLREVLKDLESLTPETAEPEDFVDLGEAQSLDEGTELTAGAIAGESFEAAGVTTPLDAAR